MESERLRYRQIAPADGAFFSRFYSSPLLTRYLPKGRPYDVAEIETLLHNRLNHWQNHGFGTYIISLQSDPAPIGYCGLEYVYESEMVDIRYGIIEQNWGMGLGFEAAAATRDHGFCELDMKQIFGAARLENLPSLRILEKLGMIRFDGARFFDDPDLQFFRITRQQFNALATALSKQHN